MFFFFDNAVTSIADIHHIVMAMRWCLVMSLHSVMSTFTMAYRDVLCNQRISNTWKFLISIFPMGWGWIRVFKIRFASTSVICGNPYTVCKNKKYCTLHSSRCFFFFFVLFFSTKSPARAILLIKNLIRVCTVFHSASTFNPLKTE